MTVYLSFLTFQIFRCGYRKLDTTKMELFAIIVNDFSS